MNDRLTPELVLSAYCQGCFPMADPETGEISFYEPDPRALISGGGACLRPDGAAGRTMDRRAD